MKQDVVIEAVFQQDVCLEVLRIRHPVFSQLFGAQHQHGLVAQLIILDDSQGREGFTKAHTVRQDAAVVGLQLVDDPCGGIALVIEQLLPDKSILVACPVVGQHVLIHIFQKFPENMVQYQKINAFRRILRVDGSDMVADCFRYVLELLGVVPNLVKQGKIG